MKGLLMAILMALLCVVPCRGLDVEELDDLHRQAEIWGVDPDAGLEQGLSDLLGEAAHQLGDLTGEMWATGVKLLAVVLLCALAEGAAGKTGALRAVELAGAMAVTALTMTDMDTMIGMGRDTIGRIDLFSSTLLPLMAVLTAAGGGITAAAARQGATVLFSQLLITAMDRLLIPLIYAYVAVNCARAALDNPGLSRLAGMLKSAATFLLTALLLAFVGYLTASGAIAGTVDASAIKAAKLTISRAVPVVGSILADASETVLAGAGVLRSTVGVTGMLVVLAICLTPFLRLALQYLLYKGAAALCAAVAQPRLAGLIDAIGSAFGIVLGMTGAAALVLLVSLVSAISGVTG